MMHRRPERDFETQCLGCYIWIGGSVGDGNNSRVGSFYRPPTGRRVAGLCSNKRAWRVAAAT